MDKLKGRILIVDDEEANLTLFGRVLERDGHQVVASRDSRDALRLIRRGTFDLVITDMLMPDLDGVELITAIRQMPGKPPVIPMSGGGTYLTAPQMLSIAVKLGATAPLIKPFSPQQLLDAVQAVFRQHPPAPPAA